MKIFCLICLTLAVLLSISVSIVCFTAYNFKEFRDELIKKFIDRNGGVDGAIKRMIYVYACDELYIAFTSIIFICFALCALT